MLQEGSSRNQARETPADVYGDGLSVKNERWTHTFQKGFLAGLRLLCNLSLLHQNAPVTKLSDLVLDLGAAPFLPAFPTESTCHVCQPSARLPVALLMGIVLSHKLTVPPCSSSKLLGKICHQDLLLKSLFLVGLIGR